MFDIILKRKEGTNVDVQKGAQIIDSVIMPGGEDRKKRWD